MEHQDAAGPPRGTGALRCALDLPPTLRAAGSARRTARAVLHAWGLGDPGTHDVVELVVTELVTNAVRHTGGPEDAPRLHLEAGDDLLVAVSDGSSIPLVVRDLADGAESGRGLGIVAALALAWGVEDWGPGKRVWVRLPVPVPPGPAEIRLPVPSRGAGSVPTA